MAQISKYGYTFDSSAEDENGNLLWDDLGIEMFMIRKSQNNPAALSIHFENARRILWPDLDSHRWHNLCRDEILSHKVCVLMGCGSSGKTHEAAWISLLDYWCFPDITCVLISSTDIRGLRKRIWDEMTSLWERGVEKFPKLAGHMLDSAIAITTDDIEDCDVGERKARSMRKGIFGVPCVQGGKFVGLSKFVGIKQKRMRLVADEASMMGENFLSAFANLNKNEDFRAIVLGNPNDPMDPLGKSAEPKDGWTDDFMEPTKTKCWDTRFMNGRCVNLVGLDSPNFDFPQNQPTRYKYLISREKIEDTLSFFPKDSMEYYSQCVGTMKIGTMAKRVLTRAECNRYKAQEQALWLGDSKTSVYFVDAAYGGDRCVAGSAEFGRDVDGRLILSFGQPEVIPITVARKVGNEEFGAEDQIAMYVRDDCESQGIPGSHMGHDSTGHGGLGTALARLWSSETHPIDAGGAPTKRLVSQDLKVLDEETGMMRPKRCDEMFDRLVSEFNYMIRLAVESGQIRNLPDECMEEFCARRWDRVKDDKYWVEPKDKPSTDPRKAGFKQRMGKSPDMADWAAGILEMARRKGFVIERVGKSDVSPASKSNLQRLAKEHQEFVNGRLINA
jgi:hypothetical protein